MTTYEMPVYLYSSGRITHNAYSNASEYIMAIAVPTTRKKRNTYKKQYKTIDPSIYNTSSNTND